MTAALAACAAPGTVSAQAPQLIWADEFDGTRQDVEANWSYQLGNGCPNLCGWGNSELQFYTNSWNASSGNFKLENGELAIIARRSGSSYSSGRIRTVGKFSFRYGRVDIRAKLPSTRGVWPALWMLPENSPYGGWAASGEIDIMESGDFADEIGATIHFGGEWPENTSKGCGFADGGDYSDDFHVYSLIWEPDRIRWLIDGVEVQSLAGSQWWSSASGAAGAPFDQPFYLLMNVAVGGNYPQESPSQGTYPQEMRIDYVRVYELGPEIEPTLQIAHPQSVATIPGTIEAETYDLGGDLAFFDTDPRNIGDRFRRCEGVDIEECSEGGHNVGWIRDGEWMEYTVDVSQTRTYELQTRVATPVGGGAFRLLVDGQPLTGTISVPNTGGWQNWQSIVTPAVPLEAGERVIRFEVIEGDFNLSWFDFEGDGPVQEPCFWDLSGDGAASAEDISIFVGLLEEGCRSSSCAVDLDDDGEATAFDLMEYLRLLLEEC